MLIVVEWNRIYAVTGKNHIITACFGAIMISQFGVGLSSIILAATCGCESLTRGCSKIILTSILQRYRFHRSHLTLIGCALSFDIGQGKSCAPACLWYTVRNLPSLSSGRRHWPDHPTDLLAFLLIAFLVVRSNVKKMRMPGLLFIARRDLDSP